MDEFFTWLGLKKSKRIRLAVMDMWKAFANLCSSESRAGGAICSISSMSSDIAATLGTERKREYGRLEGKDRRFIKGQEYTLLSYGENRSTEGRRSWRLLLKANKRLKTAYMLKEMFGELRDYQTEGWARWFLDNWRD